MKRIACIGFVFSLSTALLATPAAAQTASQPKDQSSLGDYARTVRKDTGPKSKPKVFDNDNLPKDDKLSIVGQPPPANAGDSASSEKSATPSDNPDANKPASTTEEEQARKQAAWKAWQERLIAQKD